MLAKFMNFLNGRPKLNNILTHLYKFFTSPLRGLAPGAGQARPRASPAREARAGSDPPPLNPPAPKGGDAGGEG